MPHHDAFTLKSNERIVAVIRRFLLTFFWQMLLGLALLFIAFFFMFWFFAHNWWGQTAFFITFWGGVLILMRIFVIQKRNVCYITTHRIIDMERKGLFDTVMSEIPYDQIEDVSGRITGFFGAAFRYGSVTIQTGGGTVRVVVSRIRRPLRVQTLINDLREAYQEGRNSRGSAEDVIRDIGRLSLPELRRVERALKELIASLGGK